MIDPGQVTSEVTAMQEQWLLSLKHWAWLGNHPTAKVKEGYGRAIQRG